MGTKLIVVFFLFFFDVLLCNAQMVNTELLYVSPNTIMSVMSDFDNQGMGKFENNGEVLFRGNFNNDGITTFNPAYKGNTRFVGFKNQRITGKILIEFNNILFENSCQQPAFKLDGAISISGNAEFSRGIISNEDEIGSIEFTQNGTHTGASNDSYVDGDVIKEGDLGFIYPIGNGNQFRYTSMSAPVAVFGRFANRYFYKNSNPSYPHTSKEDAITLIDDKEYWKIVKEAGDGDVLVTLSWDEATTPAAIIGNQQETLRVVRWDTAKSKWVDEGGVVDKLNKTVTTGSTVSGYGIFTLARGADNYTVDDTDVVVYNGVTPNGDGHNDYFFIDGITKYPRNKVVIFNRWGVKVFETTNYDSAGNVFNGYSNGRTTINKGDLLPSGTYFYSMEYEKTGVKPQTIKKAGYLYIKITE